MIYYYLNELDLKFVYQLIPFDIDDLKKEQIILIANLI